MNTSTSAWRFLVASASAPYGRSGRFALHFARGKLRWDPVFRHLIGRGLIAPRSRVLDIGCGQGLLASLLHAASAQARHGAWPADWAEAPLDAQVTGIELAPRDVSRARQALGASAAFVCGDMRHTAFPKADTVVILDALHYVSIAEQDDVLARARSALGAGGQLVLRVGDAASWLGFASSQWIDRIVAFARGQRAMPRSGRTLAEWRDRLLALGFEVSSLPMRSGTPFANVLLVGTVRRMEAAA
jgi:SAM-dependent methyltransferase